MRVVRAFEERRVDGIIVTSSRVGAVYAELLSQAHVPIVLLNNQHPSEFMHSVMIENLPLAARPPSISSTSVIDASPTLAIALAASRIPSVSAVTNRLWKLRAANPDGIYRIRERLR